MGVKSRNMQEVLKLRVSKDDREWFVAAASCSGLTVSGWMRAVLLEKVAELRGRKVLS
jgi:uncharacterized protein (DUF1778 family)